MPQYVDELFRLAGKDPKDYFRYERLENVCLYFYEDGTRINAFVDPIRFSEEIAAKTSDTAASVISFLDKSKEIYEITNPVFLEKSLHKIRSYLNFRTLKSVFRFSKIDAFRSMNEAVEDRFHDSKTIRLFNRYATYNGSNPYQAPATLNVIPHFEQHFGAYFPVGGMYSIVSSLYGSSSNSQFSAFLRHANFSSKVKGLYFAGGSVHPGGGIPLALLSAKIVDGLIKEVSLNTGG